MYDAYLVPGVWLQVRICHAVRYLELPLVTRGSASICIPGTCTRSFVTTELVPLQEESARTLGVLDVDGYKERFDVKEHTHCCTWLAAPAMLFTYVLLQQS